MKKTSYIVPVTNVIKVNTETLCAVSGVGGTAGLTMGDGDAPTTADGRRGGYSVWDDEED